MLEERNISLIEPVQFEADENLDERDDLFVSYTFQTILKDSERENHLAICMFGNVKIFCKCHQMLSCEPETE